MIVLITLTSGFFSEIDVRMFGKTSGLKSSLMSLDVDFVASEILMIAFLSKLAQGQISVLSSVS